MRNDIVDGPTDPVVKESFLLRIAGDNKIGRDENIETFQERHQYNLHHHAFEQTAAKEQDAPCKKHNFRHQDRIDEKCFVAFLAWPQIKYWIPDSANNEKAGVGASLKGNAIDDIGEWFVGDHQRRCFPVEHGFAGDNNGTRAQLLSYEIF